MLAAVDSAKTIHALGGITLICALEANCCCRSPGWEDIAYIKDQAGGGSQPWPAPGQLWERGAHDWTYGTKHKRWRGGLWLMEVPNFPRLPHIKMSHWTSPKIFHVLRNVGVLPAGCAKRTGRQGHCWPRGKKKKKKRKQAEQSLSQPPRILSGCRLSRRSRTASLVERRPQSSCNHRNHGAPWHPGRPMWMAEKTHHF